MVHVKFLFAVVALVAVLSLLASWRLHLETFISVPAVNKGSSSSLSLSRLPSNGHDEQQQQRNKHGKSHQRFSQRRQSGCGDRISLFFGDSDRKRAILLGGDGGAAAPCSIAGIFRDIAALAYHAEHSHHRYSALRSCKIHFPSNCRLFFSASAAAAAAAESKASLGTVVVDWVTRGLVAGKVCQKVSFTESNNDDGHDEDLDVAVRRGCGGGASTSRSSLLLIPSQQIVVDTRDAIEFLRVKLWSTVTARNASRPSSLTARTIIERDVAPIYAHFQRQSSKRDAALAASNIVVVTNSPVSDSAHSTAEFLRSSFSPLAHVEIAGRAEVDRDDIVAKLAAAHVVLFTWDVPLSVHYRVLPSLLAGTVVLSSSGDFELEALASWLSVDYSSSSIRLVGLSAQRRTKRTAFETYFKAKSSATAGDTDGAGGTGAFADRSNAPRSLRASDALISSFSTAVSNERVGDFKALFSAVLEALASSYARRYRFSNIRIFDMRRN